MSLNWDARQVKQWDSYTSDQKSIVTNGIVWHALICGFNRVTEKNAEEVYRRIAFQERVNGALLHSWDAESDTPKDYFITREDVKLAIGLTTNVSDLTKAQFTKRIWDTFNDKQERERRDALKPEVTRG